jgi:hypothetical protein
MFTCPVTQCLPNVNEIHEKCLHTNLNNTKYEFKLDVITSESVKTRRLFCRSGLLCSVTWCSGVLKDLGVNRVQEPWEDEMVSDIEIRGYKARLAKCSSHDECCKRIERTLAMSHLACYIFKTF